MSVYQYLAGYKAAGETSTHLCMTGGAGGKFNIPPEKWDEFMEKHYKYTCEEDETANITEKKGEFGSVVVDIDMHYALEVKDRLHTESHIYDLVEKYQEELGHLLIIPPNATIKVFVTERLSGPYRLPGKRMTKDGIHLVFGLQLSLAGREMLHHRINTHVGDIFGDLPITNLPPVKGGGFLDEGVNFGSNQWTVYGSAKKEFKPYKLSQCFTLSTNATGQWNTIVRKKLDTPALVKAYELKHYKEMSAQYTGHPNYPIKPEHSEEFARRNQVKPTTSTATATAPRPFRGNSDDDYTGINSEAMLLAHVEGFLASLDPREYRVREAHLYTMALPETFYSLTSGSYDKWSKVCMALASAGRDDLFLTFLQFSSQATGFDWATHPAACYKLWHSFINKPTSKERLTYRSIVYWCKEEAPDAYALIKKNSIDEYLNNVLFTETNKLKATTEWDLAYVLYQMFKHEFVCTSVQHNTWFQFKNHHWVESDSANDLRKAISVELYQEFNNKTHDLTTQVAGTVTVEDAATQKKNAKEGSALSKVAEICTHVRQTAWKNRIMIEAKELFYDPDFNALLNANCMLMGFTNCVVDFETRTARPGRAQDYLTLCTNIEYHPHPGDDDPVYMEVSAFMKQLFPGVKRSKEGELRQYVWTHLAACLLGGNKNQTFNIYQGSGANGKSALVELFSKGLGQYKATAPISLVTSKRPSIGGSSSEVAQLVGVRYAVMQEPSPGDKINEGAMKELTGGDPVQARALFKNSITFKPQFTLAVCTNSDFDDLSSDDAVWRRIRKIDFNSKFMEQPYGNEAMFPRRLYPHQFPLDKELNTKFERWAPVLMAKLVQIAFNTKGVVKDCVAVTKSCADYRKKHDFFRGFVEAKIIRKDNVAAPLGKPELLATFKAWYALEFSEKKTPRGKDLFEMMDKAFGPHGPSGWLGIVLRRDDDAPEVVEAAPEVDDDAPEVDEAAPEVDDDAPEVDDDAQASLALFNDRMRSH